METAVVEKLGMDNSILREALAALDTAETDVSSKLYGLTREEPSFQEYRGGTIKFTGWKFALESQQSDGGFVAQWCWYRQEPPDANFAVLGSSGKLCVYVNLPGGQFGTYQRGGNFSIGHQCVKGNETEEEIRTMVTNGKRKLLTLVDILLSD